MTPSTPAPPSSPPQAQLSPAPQRSVSVIVSARGDEPHLLPVIATFRTSVAENLVAEVIVVLAGRSDVTADPLRASGARVVLLPGPAGYARQVEVGVEQARHDLVALFDATDGYRPNDLARLLSHMHRYEMVVGVREGGHGAGVGRAVARKALRWLAELVTGQVVPDPTSGFRVLKRGLYARYAALATRGAGLTSVLTVGAMSDGRAVAFVPVAYQATPRGGGQPLRGWVELAHLMGRLALLFNPLRVFAMPAYALLGSGSALLALGAFLDGRPNPWGVLLFLWGAIVLATAFLADVVGAAARAAAAR